MQKWIMKHVRVGFENTPVLLGNKISCFTTIGGSKVKWAMDERIMMGQVKPFMKRK